MRLTKSGTIKAYCLLCLWSLSCLVVSAQIMSDDNYQRGSVIHMMIEHPMYMFNNEIASAFRRIPLSDRFNNHDLGVKVVKFATQEFADQENYISSFISQSKLGNRAVAKWFSWDKVTGKFNMSLVGERGLYNANALNRLLASKTVRGSSILRDAGENLIPNTYLLMSDICYTGVYTNKEAQMHAAKGKRRFDVKIVTYIYQLDWDEERLYGFYDAYYPGTMDFVNQAPYGFIYRAQVETTYGEEARNIPQSTLIERVVARCLDINIAKLQKVYPDFRIKATMVSADPILADVGLKEGLTSDDVYEVLEKEIDEDGIVTLTRVGIIQPLADQIRDNRYMASDDHGLGSDLQFTTFRKVSGKDLAPGMLIREME